MPKTKQEPQLVDSYRSHWVTLDHQGLSKEEVFPRFLTEWRGEQVVVTMSCDRYRHSSGLSEWRVYASEARVVDPNAETPLAWHRGSEVTDLARRRLSDECKPLALAWLDSVEYRQSERIAYTHAIKRALMETRTGDSREARTMFEQHRDKVLSENALLDAFDAFDAYQKALDHV